MSSTIRSLPSTISSKVPWLVVSTPEISGRLPTSASIASARLSSSSLNAEPTVPCPRRPTRKGSDVTRGQVVVCLTADHEPRVAVLAEVDRWPGERVVVVGHRMAVGAGGGDHEQVAGTGLVELDIAHEHVAGLAMHPRDRAQRVLAKGAPGGVPLQRKPTGDLGLVARGVEHWAQVV